MRRRQPPAQRGNAVLISLILMAAAMVIALGLSSLVASEIRTVGNLLPSERAYYKSESYVEQALWNKAKGLVTEAYGPGYQVTAKDQSDGNGRPAVQNQPYVCNTAPCFTAGSPNAPNQLLVAMSATTSPINNRIGLSQDVSKQVDVVNTGAASSRATIDVALTELENVNAYRGLEVSIIAWPKNPSGAGSFVGGAGNTPVFVDKRFIRPNQLAVDATGNTRFPIRIGTGNNAGANGDGRNPSGELYPPFDTHNYRLRFKSLGTDAEVLLTATSPNGATVQLRSPDFSVQATTEDGQARRGVQVLVPESPQVVGVFDYVLFADQDIQKLDAKIPLRSSLRNEVTYLPASYTTTCTTTNGRPLTEADQTPWPNITVRLDGGAGGPQTTTTSAAGVATFDFLLPDTNYYVTVFGKAGWQFCPNLSTQPNDAANVRIPPAPGTTLNSGGIRTQRFVFRPACRQEAQGGVWRWVDNSRWELRNPEDFGYVGSGYRDEPYQGFDRWFYLGSQYDSNRQGHWFFWGDNYRSELISKAPTWRNWYHYYMYFYGFVWVRGGYFQYFPNYVWVCPSA